MFLALTLASNRSEAVENAPGASPRDFAGSGVVCDPNDPESCAAPLLRNAPAPFSGQLTTPKLSISLGLKAQYCDARIGLEVEHTKALDKLDLELERKLRAVDELTSKSTIEALRRQMETLSPPVYERPWFVATVTAVVVVGVYALAMKSVDWIKVSRGNN